MNVRSMSSASCTLSLHKSFLQGFEFQRCLQFEKTRTGYHRLIGKRCNHPVYGRLSSDVVEDSALVDIQDSGDGFVLFKFGNTRLYDDNMQCSVSSSPQLKSGPSVEGNREANNCAASVYEAPDGDPRIGSYPWVHHTIPPADVSSSIACHCGNSAELPGPASSSEKLAHLPLGFVGPLNFTDYILGPDARNEAFERFVHMPSSTSATMKDLPSNISVEDINAELMRLGSEVVQPMKPSAARHADRTGKRAKLRQRKPVRDLYKSSSFQVYALVFCYPFMDATKTFSLLKTIPKERYTELFVVINQIAVGLAGSGLALVLFVASRMLCLHATLDGIKMMSLVRGLGLLWLSSALQRFGSVIKLMAECAEKARSERKEQVAILRKEVHSVTFKDDTQREAILHLGTAFSLLNVNVAMKISTRWFC